ncbi:MAG: amidohydrolase family protein, partial [Steroidobacteraceae bacterium]
MRRFHAWLLSVLFAPALLAAQPAAESQSVVFTHVTVVDTARGASKTDMSVVVSGGRIAAVGRSVRVPEGARVLDASGKFLIPGLWDMHSHLGRKEQLPLFIANGVTGVRFMNSDPAYLQWRKDIESGSSLGPRMVIGVMVDGPKPVNPTATAVANAAEARQAVIDVKRSGADFVKVYSLLPKDAFYAIADEARKQGIPFGGHVPRSVTPAEASDAGQKSIEHLSGIAFSCSKLEAQYPADMEQLQADLARVGARSNYLVFLRRLEGKYLDAYDADKCASLFARFKRNGTWQVPTFGVTRSGALLGDPGYVNPRSDYLPAGAPRKTSMYRNFTAADYATMDRILARNLEIVGGMLRAGVPILAGTDTAPVGFTLHDELALLVKAGMTPLQALQAATLKPARYLGRERELGTVQQGKLADLVLLSADPLADIHNTQKIDAVVTGGRLLERSDLDRLLAEARNGADNTRTSLALTHTSLVDVTAGTVLPNMTVLIEGDRIVATGATDRLPVPKEAEVVDATGKFLMPGLWDMHVHWYQKDYLPLFIANGVTGVRMMWGMLEHHQWRKQIAAGTLLGPRLNIASPIIDGPKPIWKGSIGVGNAAEAKAAVIKAKEEGADFIKVYSLLPRDAYFAIADETKKQGMPFAGHVPEAINAREASNAGQKSIEHLTGVLLASSSREQELREQMLGMLKSSTDESSGTRFRRLTVNVKAMESYDPQKAADLFTTFRNNHTWQVPTLTVLRSITHLDDPNFTNDPRLKYMPASMRSYWDPARDARFKMYTAENWAQSRKVYAKYL